MNFPKKKKKRVELSHPSIEQARTIANWMDSSLKIPFVRKKIGLDPLLGLLPVGGDIIATVIGLYIIYLAYDLGLPRQVLIRMGVNTLIDTLIGCIPVVGDLSDAFIKSNQWNVRLMEEAYRELVTANPRSAASSILDIQAELA